MDSTLQYLLSKLEEERTRLTEGLADGSAKSYEEYKFNGIGANDTDRFPASPSDCMT